MAVRFPAAWLDELRAYLLGNYEAMIAFLRKRMPAVKCTTLEATYLAWLDVSTFGLPSGELARRLEDEARVKFSPGSIYAEPKGGAFLRVNLASELLDTTDRSIGDICHDVGFSDHSYFNRVFKSIRGLTPSEYRNRSRDGKR